MGTAQPYLAAWKQLRAPIVTLPDALEASGLEAGDGLSNGMIGCWGYVSDWPMTGKAG